MPSPFPRYSGAATATSIDVPARYPIGIAGRGYSLDDTAEFTHQSIPLLRPQSDVAGQVNEGSFNPEGFWRRSQESWHEGAGQEFLDGDGSSANRFYESTGIDVWTKGKISLLPDTIQTLVTSETNLKLIAAGSHAYMASGYSVYIITDPLAESGSSLYTDVNIHAGDTPITLIQDLATDGNYVYAALGANGLHYTPRGTAVSFSYSDVLCNRVDYVAGRLMVGYGPNIYNITATGAAPPALYTHPNSDFFWVGFAEGKGHIFAAGFSGDKSVIYKTAIRPDGTALSIPSVAGRLPDGEVILSIYGYLGFILLGTHKGIRFAVSDASGNLEIGALIETGRHVLDMEGQGSFVWFSGWGTSNNNNSTLGRMNLATIVDGVAPAYASDLVAETSLAYDITSIITYNNRRIFAVASQGTFVEHATRKVASGEISSGWITYGAAEDKSAMAVDFRFESEKDARDGTATADLNGGHNASIQAMTTRIDHALGGGINTTDLQVSYDALGVRDYAFRVHQTLTRDSVDISLGPVVLRYTLKSQVSANMGSHFVIPILLSEKELINGAEIPRDVLEEFMFLSGLSGEKTAVTFQYASQSFLVTIEDSQFTPTHITQDRTGFNGTLMLKLKVGA